MSRRLDHEKLEVDQASLAFIIWLEPILREWPKSIAVTDQLDRASTSVPLNLAEGNGKFTGPDRCRYFDPARGSALEWAAARDVWVATGRCPSQEVLPGKDPWWSIVSMRVALIKANSSCRWHDEGFGSDSD